MYLTRVVTRLSNYRWNDAIDTHLSTLTGGMRFLLQGSHDFQAGRPKRVWRFLRTWQKFARCFKHHSMSLRVSSTKLNAVTRTFFIENAGIWGSDHLWAYANFFTFTTGVPNLRFKESIKYQRFMYTYRVRRDCFKCTVLCYTVGLYKALYGI